VEQPRIADRAAADHSVRARRCFAGRRRLFSAEQTFPLARTGQRHRFDGARDEIVMDFAAIHFWTVRPWTVSKSSECRAKIGSNSSKTAGESKPRRVLTVNLIFTASRSAPRMASTRRGSRRSPPPAQLRYTTGAGQPRFKSTATIGHCCSSSAVRTQRGNVVADHLRDDGDRPVGLWVIEARIGGSRRDVAWTSKIFRKIKVGPAVRRRSVSRRQIGHILHRRQREEKAPGRARGR